MLDRTAATSFLSELYADSVSPESQIVIWANANLPNRWCSTIEEAVEVLALDEYNDRSYFGLALQDPARALQFAAKQGDKTDLGLRRGYAQSAAAWPGVGLDIDVRGEGKSKPYPPTMDDALWLIDQAPIKPSILVDTGGGLHAYWLFDEPEPITDSASLERVRRVSYGFYLLLLEAARSRDWTIDNTSDLARVLRVPGTCNTKYPGPPKVEVTKDTGARYDMDALEIFIPKDLKAPAGDAGSEADVAFTIDEDAVPQLRMIDMACDLDAKFSQTWLAKRKDLDSQSEYDMSIASMGVGFGWTDQQIVDALIYHRSKNGGVPKLRSSYYRVTLSNARAGSGDSSRREVIERLTERGADPERAEAEAEQTVDDINLLIRLKGEAKIATIVRYPGDPPTYAMVTQAKEVLTLGTVRTILSAGLFREAVASVTGRIIDRHKDPAWSNIAQSILQCVRYEELGEDATPAGEMLDSLGEWLESSEVLDGDTLASRSAAIRGKRPFAKAGQLHFVVRDLMRWLKANHGDRRTKNEICQTLKKLGALPSTVGYRGMPAVGSGGNQPPIKNSTRLTWSIPRLVLDNHGATIHWPNTGQVKDQMEVPPF